MQHDKTSGQWSVASGQSMRSVLPSLATGHWPLATVLLAVTMIVGSSLSQAGDRKKPKDLVKATAAASKIDDSGKQTITINVTIEKGWHIYANPVNNDDFKSLHTLVKVKAQKDLAEVKIQYPAGNTHEDKTIGNYSVYEDRVTIPVVVRRAAGDVSPLEVEFIFNTCNAKTCLEKDSYTFTLP